MLVTLVLLLSANCFAKSDVTSSSSESSITTYNASLCPENEDYTSDKPKCPSDRCSSVLERCVPSTTGSPGCVCKPGYLRPADGEPCVPQCECSELRNSMDCTFLCPENENYTSDKPKCPSDRCSSVLERCVPSTTGSPGCVCKPGYLRPADGEPCVPQCECSELRNSMDCTNSNAEGNENVAYAFASSSSDGGNSVSSSASATSRTAEVNSYSPDDGSSRVGEEPPVTPRDHDKSPGGSICSANGTLICGSNEVLNECPSYCPSDFCPTGEGQNNHCSEPNPCPTPACKCGFNSRRAQNGTCIPTRQCPPFQCNRPNEVYDPCPPYCPSDDCSQATPTGKCPLPGRIGIVVECRPACRCRQGYWRNNGVCVPYNECPNKIQCAPGEVVDDCPAACNTDYCPTSENDVRSCFVPKPCLKPACRCPFNYLRAQNGTCIPAATCPPIKCTRANEVYASCRPFCPTDDCRQATPSGECPIPEYKDIKAECNPGCTCKKSYWRQNGTCVPFGNCGLDCSGPHEFYACGGACDAECSDLQDKPCPITNVKCNDKCYCENGYARNKKGICIPTEECPPSHANEEYTSD